MFLADEMVVAVQGVVERVIKPRSNLAATVEVRDSPWQPHPRHQQKDCSCIIFHSSPNQRIHVKLSDTQCTVQHRHRTPLSAHQRARRADSFLSPFAANEFGIAVQGLVGLVRSIEGDRPARCQRGIFGNPKSFLGLFWFFIGS